MIFINKPVNITRNYRDILHLFGEEENSSNINLIQRNNFVILYGRDAIFTAGKLVHEVARYSPFPRTCNQRFERSVEISSL